jgi:hypothetical protein
VGKSEGKRPLGRPKPRWEDNNNKMGLREVGCTGMDWIDLAYNGDRRRVFKKALIKFRVP